MFTAAGVTTIGLDQVGLQPLHFVSYVQGFVLPAHSSFVKPAALVTAAAVVRLPSAVSAKAQGPDIWKKNAEAVHPEQWPPTAATAAALL